MFEIGREWSDAEKDYHVNEKELLTIFLEFEINQVWFAKQVTVFKSRRKNKNTEWTLNLKTVNKADAVSLLLSRCPAENILISKGLWNAFFQFDQRFPIISKTRYHIPQ